MRSSNWGITGFVDPPLALGALYPLSFVLVVAGPLADGAVVALDTIALLALDVLFDEHVASPEPLAADVALEAVLALVLGQLGDLVPCFATLAVEATAALVANQRLVDFAEAHFAGLAGATDPLEGGADLHHLLLGEGRQALLVAALVAEEALQAGQRVQDVVALHATVLARPGALREVLLQQRPHVRLLVVEVPQHQLADRLLPLVRLQQVQDVKVLQLLSRELRQAVAHLVQVHRLPAQLACAQASQEDLPLLLYLPETKHHEQLSWHIF